MTEVQELQNQLVMQIKPASSRDLDLLVNWENALIEHLAGSAEVDGHDLSAGEFNIFTLTNDPSNIFKRIQSLPETRPFSALIEASYRPVDGDDFVFFGLMMGWGSTWHKGGLPLTSAVFLPGRAEV